MPPIAPWTKGIPRSQHAAYASLRPLLLSRASIAIAEPSSMLRPFFSSRNSTTANVSTAPFTAATLLAAAMAFGFPMLSSVEKSWRLRLFSSNTSGSTITISPTPALASSSIIHPPRPPQPITAAREPRSFICPLMPIVPMFLLYLSGQMPFFKAAVSTSRGFIPKSDAILRQARKGTVFIPPFSFTLISRLSTWSLGNNGTSQVY